MRSGRLIPSRVLKVVFAVLLGAGFAAVSANAQTVYNNGTGTNNGFYYSLYSSGGSATMTFPSAGQYPGNYAITWSHVNDVVGG